MKLINEDINRMRALMNLNEAIKSLDDWYEIHYELTMEIFNAIKDHDKNYFKWKLIPANQYHNALKDFVKYGSFMRFPTRYIYIWKEILLKNIVILDILTSIAGHTNSFPYDEFYDCFDYNHDTGADYDGEFTKWCMETYGERKSYDFEAVYNFLDEKYDMDDTLPLFSNGQWLLSDFGLKPLWKLGQDLLNDKTPEEMIVTINKILDVSHQRSDLAEIFIEGGSSTLSAIHDY